MSGQGPTEGEGHVREGRTRTITSIPPLSLSVRRDPGQRACLVVIAGDAVGALYVLDRAIHVIGRGPDADVRIDDQGVSRRHAQVVRGPDGAWILEDLGSTNGTFLFTRQVERHELWHGDRIAIGRHLLKFALLDELEVSLQRRLYESAVRDPLTGTFNRRYFMDRLRSELAFSARHGSTLSLLLLDLDNFKDVNDTRGHLAGDAVLRAIGALLGKLVRAEDVVARYGGEELAVLCRGIGSREAEILADRLRVAVSALEVPWPGGSIRVTTSIGVALAPAGRGLDTPERMLARADRGLYAAKSSGRNSVVGAS